MDKIATGNLIREKRIALNLTQEQLADLLHVNNKTISRWECGIFVPPVDKLYDLSKIFNISIDELLNGRENADSRIDIEKQNEETIKQYRAKNEKKLIILLLYFMILFFSGLFGLNNYNTLLYICFAFTLIQLCLASIKKEKVKAILTSIFSIIFLIITIVIGVNYFLKVNFTYNISLNIIAFIFEILSLISLTIINLLPLFKSKNTQTTLKLKKAMTISFVTLISLVSLFAATTTNVFAYSNYKLFSYNQTGMEYFLKESISSMTFFSSNNTTSYYLIINNSEQETEAKDCLESIKMVKEKNTFPYRYKENTAYVSLIIYSQNYIFRMNESFDKIALEWRQNINSLNHFSTVHYYSCDASQGQQLKDFIIEKGVTN